MAMSAGRLRERVTLQEADQVDNERGGRRAREGTERWKDVAARLPAEVTPLRGEQRVTDTIERAIATWRVTIRVRPGISPRNRLVWHSRDFGDVAMEIGSVAPNASRDGLVMIATSGGSF